MAPDIPPSPPTRKLKGKKELLEGYEVLLETAQRQTGELMVSPEGKILEVSGQEK